MPSSKPRLTSLLLIFAAALGATFALNGRGVEPVVAAAQAKPAGIAGILAQMNEASAKFTSAQADLRQENFTKAVNDTETQSGQIYFLRKTGTTQMGMKLLPPDAKPGTVPAQVIEFKDNKLQVLNTGTSQVDVFTASGKNQSLAETMMTLGFGGSGDDLQKAWTITDQGPETLTDGKPIQTEKLDLVSKDQNIRNTYSHITVWVDPARDVSLKQTLFEASGGKSTGDTRTVYYSNIRLNQNVDTNPFAIKCKGKCNFVQH
jgi:outer membrane lipoprotein-sorting protein